MLYGPLEACILEVWTTNVITVWEALLTVLQFGSLLTHAYAQDKDWPYLSLPLARTERREDWVPEETTSRKDENNVYDECCEILQLGEDENRSLHSANGTAPVYQKVPGSEDVAESSNEPFHKEKNLESPSLLAPWKQHFVDALMRLLFAFVPPYPIAHGWIAFICSLIFISGIAYIVTKLTNLLSRVTGINAYVIAFTALASGTSWPDLVASKIAAERQITADSAIANITSSNSVNIYVGIGIPWLINTAYNLIIYKEPLRIQNAGGLSFSLLVFFRTSGGCIAVLVLRSLRLGAEIGGPKPWAWVTRADFMLLWIIFIVLSSHSFWNHMIKYSLKSFPIMLF